MVTQVGLPPGERRRRRRRHPQRGQLADEHRQVGAHGRLATGEAQAVDLEALDEDPGQPLDLLERQHLAARQPQHALLGHAVGAAEVAAVGDRDAQVADGAPEGIDEIHARSGYRRAASWRRSRRARTPSPSGTTARASASAVAASWWLPWAPTEPHVVAAVVGRTRRRPACSGSCRRAGVAAPSSATATTVGRSMTVWPIILRSAGRAKQLEADQRAHRVAGQPEHRHATVARGEQPEGERLGRLDRDLHPAHVGDPRQHRLDHVVVAHADPAAGDDGVARCRRLAQHGLERRLVVADDAEVDGLAAGLGDQRRAAWSCCSRGSGPGAAASRRRPVRRRSTARRHAPGDTTRTSPGVDAGEHAGDGRADDGARRRTAAVPARTSSPTPRTDAPAATDRCDQHTSPPSRRSVSSTITDGVGTGRHRRAGHDADRLAGTDDPIGRRTGGDLGDHAQLDRGHRPRRAARTAYPSTAVLANGGTSSRGDHGVGQHQPEGVGDRCLDHARQTGNRSSTYSPGLVFADHRPERYRVRR